MKNNVQDNWIKLAEYDFITAHSMFDTARYLYVAFMCQQSLEKLLKALYIKEKNETPPYTHNLIKLVENLSINSALDESKNKFLEIINSYYIESRYTENIVEISKSLTREKVKNILKETEEFYSWLKKQI